MTASYLVGLAALAGFAAAIGTVGALVRELRRRREEIRRTRTLDLLALFARGMTAADEDPRALLVWQPLARAARELFPGELAALDRVWAGGRFPFPTDRLQSAHARWTADWLAWERAHDAEFKARAAEEAGHATRERLEAIEREKLERYQRRYEEYIRVAKALQTMSDSVS